MTKVLLIGNGAREHAIAKKIVENGAILYSYMSKENPGITDIAKEYILGDLTKFDKLKRFQHVDYAVVGPELPLSVGITNYLEDKLSIPTASPLKEVAKLETSKSFARELMKSYDIEGNPSFHICRNLDDFENAANSLNMNFVIKPDGLTGGKGVKVFGEHFRTYEEGKKYAKNLLTNDGVVLVEEKLVGREFSLQVFTDGTRVVPMPLVRDYKRAYDGDVGPNTGSMGSYSRPDGKLPFLDEKDTEKALKILKDVVVAIKKQTAREYKGVLYGQFMKTSKGVFLIEFNVRFGDPEAINVLSLLQNDYNEINQNIIDGKLSNAKFDKKATVCVYVVPKGYPVQPASEKVISVNRVFNSELYYASCYRENDQIKTTKSRALAVLSKSHSIEEARKNVYNDVKKINGEIEFRTDIGLKI